MIQPPATLADFSQFTITQIEQEFDRTLLSGHMTKPGRLSRGQQLSLFISLEDDVQGVVTELNPDTATGVISVVTQYMDSAVKVGMTFPVYDNYWVGKLHLVMDSGLHWNRMEFVAPDAFVESSEAPGWRKWRIASPSDKDRTDGQIIKGGWDHEHCELCWQKIGDGGEPVGYATESNQWVCLRCYERYLGPCDLRFILEDASDDADGPTSSLTPFRQMNQLIGDYDLAVIRRDFGDTEHVNAKSKYGWTPLMLAASKGHQSLVKLLLELGADVNAVSEQHGYTAIALAAQKGFVDLVETLLEAGATVQVPETFCGGSLLTYVKTGPGRESSRINELLQSAGAK